MKTRCLLPVACLVLLVAGCTSTSSKVSRAPLKADAHFTLDHFDASQVDVPAKAEKIVATRFLATVPKGANAANSYATVQYIVDATGQPRDVQWVETTDPAFARAAVALVSGTQFTPAMKNGTSVAVKMEMRFTSHTHESVARQRGYGESYFESPHYTEQSSNYPHDINPFTGR